MNTFRLLLLSLLLAAIPISGFSYTDDQVVDFGDCYYKVVSGTKLTLSFLGMKPGKTGPLVLPATVTDKYGYVLTIVGAEYNPQYRSAGITSVTLPQTGIYRRLRFLGRFACHDEHSQEPQTDRKRCMEQPLWGTQIHGGCR